MKKLLKFLFSFGPGIFAIGYTIGTGSVTSMIVAGNDFGMDLLWVLFLAAYFQVYLFMFQGPTIFLQGKLPFMRSKNTFR